MPAASALPGETVRNRRAGSAWSSWVATASVCLLMDITEEEGMCAQSFVCCLRQLSYQAGSSHSEKHLPAEPVLPRGVSLNPLSAVDASAETAVRCGRRPPEPEDVVSVSPPGGLCRVQLQKLGHWMSSWRVAFWKVTLALCIGDVLKEP